MLQEEILEMKNDGDILLTMGANAKIGLLGENPSRNGKKLIKVFNETDLTIMNQSNKCKGKVTRANTKKDTEVSAIDFVVASNPVCEWIKEMEIDETGLYKLKGKNESDHHTILLTVDIPHINKKQTIKKCKWNLKADDTKWEHFKDEIRKCKPKTREILNNTELNMNKMYKKVYNQIEIAARKSIGKSTFKENNVRTSKEIRALQTEKRNLKKEIQHVKNDQIQKSSLIDKYKITQNLIAEQILTEKTAYITKTLEKIIADTSRNSFWRLTKAISRDPMTESLVQYLPSKPG